PTMPQNMVQLYNDISQTTANMKLVTLLHGIAEAGYDTIAAEARIRRILSVCSAHVGDLELVGVAPFTAMASVLVTYGLAQSLSRDELASAVQGSRLVFASKLADYALPNVMKPLSSFGLLASMIQSYLTRVLQDERSIHSSLDISDEKPVWSPY